MLRRNGSGSGSASEGVRCGAKNSESSSAPAGAAMCAGAREGVVAMGANLDRGMSCGNYNTRQVHRKSSDAHLWRTSHRVVMIALISLRALGSLLRRPRGSARLRVGGRACRARHRGRAAAPVAGRAARAAGACWSVASATPRRRRSRSPTAPSSRAEVSGVGADWVGARAAAVRARSSCPLASIAAIGMPHADMLRSARPRRPARRSPSA